LSENNNVKVTNEILLAAKYEDKRLSMVSKNSSIHSTIKNLSQLLCIDVTNINEGQFSKVIKGIGPKILSQKTLHNILQENKSEVLI
jgi:hypothetical protein